MNMFNEQIKKYAKLLVEVGVNLQEGEGLILHCNIDSLPVAREVVKIAYQNGAKDVYTMISDDQMTLNRYQYAKDSVFDSFPAFMPKLRYEMYMDNYHLLAIRGANPALLKDIDPDRIARDNKTVGQAMQEVTKYQMDGTVRWCLGVVPTPEWAQLVFPDLSEEEAMKLLWEKIFDATRVKMENPVVAWQAHDAALKEHKDYLNQQNFKQLIFHSPDTDLTVELADDHFWMGGSKQSKGGVSFVANIPTEEVFTTPHRMRVNGHVKATKALSYSGKIIDGFGFTFKDGEIVDFYAEEGYDVLKNLLASDEGSKRLGEVALVPDDSPISNTNILFRNTLFDENASIHLAIGRAYSYAMKGGSEASTEELIERGANQSIVHVDFMIGGPTMNVTAVTQEGAHVKIFENGNWVSGV